MKLPIFIVRFYFFGYFCMEKLLGSTIPLIPSSYLFLDDASRFMNCQSIAKSFLSISLVITFLGFLYDYLKKLVMID
ncbi:hypothetical protein ES332_A07G132900v1 [Gossypium tomentosum]|uniref:Uncharacterized protein n=1 Tax=Gossypium tomentosum TaxID=34277 RepID=A0A5D2PSI7_GOSTO|nr:hypothetical protein ES332_A07G132900v1 [Gossypium tomentosum]